MKFEKWEDRRREMEFVAVGWIPIMLFAFAITTLKGNNEHLLLEKKTFIKKDSQLYYA